MQRWVDGVAYFSRLQYQIQIMHVFEFFQRQVEQLFRKLGMCPSSWLTLLNSSSRVFTTFPPSVQ
jgi:hypothetical protein